MMRLTSVPMLVEQFQLLIEIRLWFLKWVISRQLIRRCFPERGNAQDP